MQESDDALVKPKKKNPTFVQNLSSYINEYVENTTIQGIRYLGEPNRTMSERIWWLTILTTFVLMCLNQISKTYQRWDIGQSSIPVWQIPFPAITICPETKSRQSAYNFTENYHRDKENMTEEELKMFEDISLVCDSRMFREGNETTNYDAIDFLSKVAPQFNEMFWICKWNYHYNETCAKMFTPILTEEGICYTFNMLDRDDIYTSTVHHYKEFLKHGEDAHGWNLENGYNKTERKDTFPRRAISSGAKSGLTLLLRAYERDMDYICKGIVQGFKILLHHPGELPRVSHQYFRAAFNQEVTVSVKPGMSKTSESLKSYSQERRQCYFPNEKELRFFKNYTQQNCEVECLTNFTLAACGCVAYHMPHNESTPICGTANILCMAIAQMDLVDSQVDKQISGFGPSTLNTTEANMTNHLECHCLPACTKLVYNMETTQVDFDWRKLFLAFKANPSQLKGMQLTRVTIFFKELQFIVTEHNELYNLTDFLANSGGLLALFMGFSLVSVVETIYYFSLRLIFNLQLYGLHYWSGSPSLLNKDDLHNA